MLSGREHLRVEDALILATALEYHLGFVSRDKQLRFTRDEYGFDALNLRSMT